MAFFLPLKLLSSWPTSGTIFNVSSIPRHAFGTHLLHTGIQICSLQAHISNYLQLVVQETKAYSGWVSSHHTSSINLRRPTATFAHADIHSSYPRRGRGGAGAAAPPARRRRDGASAG